VKYTVKDPGNPSLYRDYWVEVRFVKDSLSLAEISAFRFMAADNPDLSGDVTAVIDQGAGTIYAVLPFTGPPPSGNGGHRTLVPRWLAQGTVRVGGVTQNSGQSGQVFSPSVVYRAVSADGAFHKDYTVKVLEVNTRMYVKKNAAGDNTGVSWANAFRSLGDACDAAGYLPTALAAEVWIAEGTYRPSETRDKAAYFTVRPNTGYYGGFAGTETAKDGRNPDPTAHRVIITGDLGGGVYSEHLFINTNLGGGNAAFGEMTFTKARGPLTGLGSAMHVSGANSVAITNSVFEDLQAGPGGVVYVSLFSGGSVTITDCDFENIQATGYGGAVYATAYGGSGGSVTITNCDFENTQSTLGGAVYAAASGGSVTITDCDFKNTQAGNGGAVAALASSTGSVTITDCDFENTRAELSGGAVHVSTSSGASVTITDCEFTDTETTGAYGSGGAVYAYGSGGSVTITDCDFTDTKATAASSRGGAVYARSNGAVSITNCGFTNTQTEEYGGAVYAYGGSVTISGYTSNITRALAGGSLFLSTSNSGLISVTDAEITDSKTVNSLSDGSFSGGGGICVSNAGSTTFSNVKFENVHAMGSVTNTIGGAVRFSMGSLVMTNCSIEDASSDTFGGAIAGSGSSSCTLEGVSFTSCAAPQGSILYGNEWSPGAGPAYIVKPGCEVNGIPITAANLLSVLASPSQRYLINGSTIGWSP
ncbi:MAG: right-handed parallel beta-helix repeat-containing protein, partial [Treponema sp.]|nr:right-handed parallel beta-helix repeat-containing protein [Treponema sp.]